MPTYQYACTECGRQHEAVQSFSDPALTECPACHGRLRKVYGAVGVVFKGSGFYKTDSRAKAGAGAATAPEGGSSGGSDGASGSGAAASGSGSGGSGSGGSGSGGSGSGGSKPGGSKPGGSGSGSGSGGSGSSGGSRATPATSA